MNNSSNSSLPKVFVWLAWIFAIGIITYGFNDFLENQVNPNQQVDSRFSNKAIEVVLQQNHYGHYVVNGNINNAPVTFLLDTGATSVSIPESVANSIGLQKQNSYFVNTANGRIKVYQTTLDVLRIGEINLYNVDANINPNDNTPEILLGMSALKQIEFRQQGKQLTLLQHR